MDPNRTLLFPELKLAKDSWDFVNETSLEYEVKLLKPIDSNSHLHISLRTNSTGKWTEVPLSSVIPNWYVNELFVFVPSVNIILAYTYFKLTNERHKISTVYLKPEKFIYTYRVVLYV